MRNQSHFVPRRFQPQPDTYRCVGSWGWCAVWRTRMGREYHLQLNATLHDPATAKTVTLLKQEPDHRSHPTRGDAPDGSYRTLKAALAALRPILDAENAVPTTASGYAPTDAPRAPRRTDGRPDDPEQEARLRGRQAALVARQPGWAALRDALLAVGGREVVMVDEDDLAHLLDPARARVWTDDGPPPAVLEAGQDSQCHGNVARLYALTHGPVPRSAPRLARELRQRYGAVAIATGWALSDDGLWRQHSWALAEDRTSTGGPAPFVIDTTEVRLRYYGVALTPEEAEGFVVAND